MQYLLLIYESEAQMAARSESEMAEYIAAYKTFTAEVAATGAVRGGEALKPTATATSVRLREGRMIVSDGPFAETREALGGFYLIEAEDLDQAIAIAGKIPTAACGTIEIRPIQRW